MRKQAYGEGKDDDAWKVQIFSVTLYDAEPLQQGHYREFFLDAPNELWLANENGHQVWLKELDLPSGAVAAQTRR